MLFEKIYEMRRFVKRTRVKYNQRNYLSQRNYLFRYLLIILFGELRGLINVTCRRFLELRKDQMSIQDKFIYIYLEIPSLYVGYKY